MKIRTLFLMLMAGLLCLILVEDASAQTRVISKGTNSRRYDAEDWNRFRYYPYVYYTQNFRSPQEYRSSDDMYYRYNRSMQVPTYNPYWQNYYPVPRRFHEGKHFLVDIF